MPVTRKSVLFAAVIAVFGISSLTSINAADTNAEAAIAAAKDAQKQAQSVGGQWRDTRKLIKRAEKMLQQGKLEKAVELAREAEAQGMLGYLQATSQTKDKLHI